MKFDELKIFIFYICTLNFCSSFIGSRDIANLLLFIKLAFFGEKSILNKIHPKVNPVSNKAKAEIWYVWTIGHI